jgi:putative redox protein
MTTQPTPTPTPTKRVNLRWTGNGTEYEGVTGAGEPFVIDGKSLKGPGPMDALLLAVAGCMAVDVQVILERSRVPLTGMEISVEGERASTRP